MLHTAQGKTLKASGRQSSSFSHGRNVPTDSGRPSQPVRSLVPAAPPAALALVAGGVRKGQSERTDDELDPGATTISQVNVETKKAPRSSIADRRQRTPSLLLAQPRSQKPAGPQDTSVHPPVATLPIKPLITVVGRLMADAYPRSCCPLRLRRRRTRLQPSRVPSGPHRSSPQPDRCT